MKRKVLISVLTVALVLTLCIGLLVACNPDKDKKPASSYKVSVYGTDGTKLGEETAQLLDGTDGDYWMTDPAQQFGLKADQYKYLTYQLYDESDQTTKGAFDYRSFKADKDFSIKVVEEGIGSPAESIEEKFYGDYYLESRTGDISTVEIMANKIGLTLVNGMETIEASGLRIFSTVWLKDSSYIIEYEYELEAAEDGEEAETFYTYYAFSLSADNNTLTVTNLSDIADGPYLFARKPELTATVHYTLNGQEKTAELKTMSGPGKSYILNDPLEALDDAGALMEELQLGEQYAVYYYDANAADKKGEPFDGSGFEASANFDLIIIKYSIGTPATSIDSSWYGTYMGQSRMGNTMLTISGEDGGKLVYDDSMEPAEGSVQDGKLFVTADGKLVLAKQDWFGGYSYIYFSKGENGAINMESDSATMELSPCESLDITIYYQIGEDLRHYNLTVYSLDGNYSLDNTPEYCLDDDGFVALMGELDYGQEFAYYYYINGTDETEEFDWTDFSSDEAISIIIKIETFATVAQSIDSKFDGTYRGTSEYNGDFTITISAANKTVRLAYDDEDGPYPIEASAEEGKVLLTEDGQLVFAAGSMAKYATYYYISDEDGEFYLSNPGNEHIALTKSEREITFADLVGKYTSGENTLIVSTFGAGENVDTLYGECAGSVIYKGELIYVEFGKTQDGKTAISGMFNAESQDGDHDGFLAIYENNSLTIGTETYAFGGAAMEADISDFSGFWARSDTNQYWSISGSGIKYGTNLSDAEYEIIGDYIYLYYTTLSSTYYYLLQVNDAGATKTLAGTFVAPSKAPQAVTFNATEEYIPTPETLYEYTGDITIALRVGQTDMRLTKLELDSKTAPTYARATLSLGGGEAKAYALTEGVNFRPMTTTPYPKSSYLFKKQIDSAQATFVFAIIDDYTLDIYNFDTDTKAGSFTAPGAPETGGTGGGTEAPSDGTVYTGSATVGTFLGSVTIVKIEIDDLDSPKKFTITLSDDTVCEISEFDDDTSYATENVANLKGAYTFDFKASGKTYSATIAILNDGSIAVYTEYSCDELATGGDSFQK